MSMSGRLKSYVERIEKLLEERKALGGDIKDVFSEAKGVGYDVKTMRKVIALRALDAAERDQQQTLLDTYWHELEQIDRVQARVAAGEPVKRATEAEGYSRATYYRVSQRASKATNETHDPETGEIKETEVAVPPGDGEAPASNDAAGTPSPSIDESCGGVESRHAECPNDAVARAVDRDTPPSGQASTAGVAPGPQETDWDAINATHPKELRGSRQRVAA